MENTIEVTEEKKKVGVGIIIMSILDFIGQGFMIIGYLTIILAPDLVSEQMKNMGSPTEINVEEYFIPLAISLIIVISVILILCKKSIGAFLFIGIEVLSLIYKVITAGFNIGLLILLVFPALMLLFLYRKKDIYFTKA